MRYVSTVENGRTLPSTMRRILVPVDFSDASTAALEYAMELAEAAHASVDVLHVWDLPPYTGMAQYRAEGTPRGQAEPLTTHVHDLATARLDELVESARRPGVEVVGVLESGDPLAVIPRLAERFDLLVLGAHDDDSAAGLLFGNVGDRLAGEVRCPVVSVRRDEDDVETKRMVPAS
jgi:nucleotide-binding universal stress UspA family protein